MLTRKEIINQIIQYTKLNDKDKLWYNDAIKFNYYKDHSLNNLKWILKEYNLNCNI